MLMASASESRRLRVLELVALWVIGTEHGIQSFSKNSSELVAGDGR